MIRLAFIAITTLALAGLVSANPGTNKATAGATAKLSDADVRVVAHVHAVNQAEIAMGKLAQKNGSAAVNKYGAMLIKDHTSADKEVIAFAKSHGLTKIPADAPLSPADEADQKATMDRMKMLTGASFDHEFLIAMVDGHIKEIAKVDVAMATASDPTLVALLGTIKPVLQKHADDAIELQKAAAAKS